MYIYVKYTTVLGKQGIYGMSFSFPTQKANLQDNIHVLI